MKNIITLLAMLIAIGSFGQKTKSDVKYSFSYLIPMLGHYETLVIDGRKAHYTLETNKKKWTKDFVLSKRELKTIEKALLINKFYTIRIEEHPPLDGADGAHYMVGVENGQNEITRYSATIKKEDVERWQNIVKVFEDITKRHVDVEKMKN